MAFFDTGERSRDRRRAISATARQMPSPRHGGSRFSSLATPRLANNRATTSHDSRLCHLYSRTCRYEHSLLGPPSLQQPSLSATDSLVYMPLFTPEDAMDVLVEPPP